MKITIDRTNLLRSLSHIQSVVERRNTIPILANVKLGVDPNTLTLNATDLDLEISVNINTNSSTPGSTTVPAHTLYEIIRKLPEGSEVEIESISENQLVLRSGRYQTTLSSLPTTDFPVMDTDNYDHRFTIPADNLRQLIDRTKFAISNEETRYYLNGIYLHSSENASSPMLRAVATDGHRLASKDIPLPDGAENIPGIILPRKMVSELRKLIEETDDEIQISASENKVRLEFGNAVLVSKLIDGTFPDYQRVIPTNNDQFLEIDCQSFANAVDRVSAISAEKSRAVKLNIARNKLTLEAFSPEHGSASEELDIEYGGNPIEIGFNAAYLLDITRQISSDSINIAMADSGSPTMFSEKNDNSALFVLMPMRV